jgi:hypothetical protein
LMYSEWLTVSWHVFISKHLLFALYDLITVQDFQVDYHIFILIYLRIILYLLWELGNQVKRKLSNLHEVTQVLSIQARWLSWLWVKLSSVVT